MSEAEHEDHDLPPPLGTPSFDPVRQGHNLIRAVEDVGYTVEDAAKFIGRLKNIDYGLNAEAEFATLLAWLGRCEMVHHLGQEVMSSDRRRKWHIPDLFVVLRKGGERFSAMVEVKTTGDELLVFKNEYIEGLRNYCSQHLQPLLLAWRPRCIGPWFLVSPEQLHSEGDKLRLDLETAWKNSLMGCLAGDFSIHRVEGSGLFVEMDRQGEKAEAEGGYSAPYVIRKAEWRDGQGRAYESLSLPITTTILTKAAPLDHVGDPTITKAWVCDGSFVHAQEVLRTIVTFWSADDGPIRWNHVYDNFDRILSRDRLLEGLLANLGTFVKFIGHLLPSSLPASVPESWREIPSRRG